MNIIIPMAGLGSRFTQAGYDIPKPLIQVDGKTLIRHSIESLNIPDTHYIFVARRYENEDWNRQLAAEIRKLNISSRDLIQLDEVTSGSVETALIGYKLIRELQGEKGELIITNCDQYLDWDSNEFLRTAEKAAGAVVTYPSTNPKNSFCRSDKDGNIVEFVEKKAISNDALVGVHYWKKASDFEKSAQKLMKDFKRKQRPECYISETYNYMLQDTDKVVQYQLGPNRYWSLGTPEDVKKFVGMRKEFGNQSQKPKTLFIDLDGTIFKHAHRYSKIYPPELLPGVREKLDEWDSIGHRIILVTARKESARELTEESLRILMVPYDKLIMGVANGPRVLINDKLNFSEDRAIAINVLTDEGFGDVNL